MVGSGILEGGTAAMYPSPLGANLKSARHQYLFRASELRQILGNGPQTIYGFSLQVALLNSTTSFQNFTVEVGTTIDDSLTNFVSSIQQVFDPKTVNPVISWNDFRFDRAYSWDGISNLVVDLCFENATNGSFNNKLYTNSLPFKATFFGASNSAPQCGTNGTQQGVITFPIWQYHRPNVRFMTAPRGTCYISPTLHYQWAPLTGLSQVYNLHDSSATTVPNSSQIYSVVVSDTNFCTSPTAYTFVYIDTFSAFNATLTSRIENNHPDTVWLDAHPLAKSYDWFYKRVSGNYSQLPWHTPTITAIKPDSGFYYAIVTDTVSHYFDSTNTVRVNFEGCYSSNYSLHIDTLAANEYRLCVSPTHFAFWYFHDSITGIDSLLDPSTYCYTIHNFPNSGDFYGFDNSSVRCTRDTVTGTFHYHIGTTFFIDTSTTTTTLTAAPSHMNYTWFAINFNGDTIFLGNSQTITLPDTFDGDVFVIVTGGGSSDTSNITHISPRSANPNGIAEIEKIRFYVFPNPAKNEVSVYLDEKIIPGELLNLHGQRLRTFSQQQSQNIPIGDLARGVYIVQVKTARGVFRHKLILE